MPGEKNPADVFTKPDIPQARTESLLQCMGCEFQSGRAETAPTLRTEGGTKTFSLVDSKSGANPVVAGRCFLKSPLTGRSGASSVVAGRYFPKVSWEDESPLDVRKLRSLSKDYHTSEDTQCFPCNVTK